MQMISVTDALDAMERNVRAFLAIAGEKPGHITARIDPVSGTASIKHWKDSYTGQISVDVRFPCMNSAAKLSKAELDRWTGYFLHELCHALYTQEDAWQAACAERIHALVNALEDVRIETKFNKAAIAANSTTILNALLSWCVESLPATYDPNDMKDLPWLLAMAGRVYVCGYALPDAERQLAKLSPAMARLVADVMAETRKAQSTWDIVAIVRKLKARLAPKPGKPESENKSGDQPGKPETQPGKPESEGAAAADVDETSETTMESAGETAPESESEESKPETQPESESSGGAPAGAGDGQGEGASGDAPLVADVESMNDVEMDPVSDAVKDVANVLRKNGLNANRESNVCEAIRKAQRNAGKARPTMESVWLKDPTLSVAELQRDAMRAGKLKAQVARVLKAAENETYERNRPNGRLDRTAMARIGAGQFESVYARRTFSSGYETEISVLIDHSGSMSGAPAWAASSLALTIAQAAQMVGVKCDILSFSSTEFETVKATKETASAPLVLKRLARLGLTSGGSTPLSSCIIQSAAKLASRAPAKRKLLFVVSDGDCDSGEYMVRKACDYAERVEVETVALCINVPVHMGFRHGVTCNVSNIASAGLGVLVKALERESL